MRSKAGRFSVGMLLAASTTLGCSSSKDEFSSEELATIHTDLGVMPDVLVVDATNAYINDGGAAAIG